MREYWIIYLFILHVSQHFVNCHDAAQAILHVCLCLYVYIRERETKREGQV